MENLTTAFNSEMKSLHIQPMSALHLGVTTEQFKLLCQHHDVFTRIDVHDELIIDCVAFGEDEIGALTNLLKCDCSEFAGSYVIIYIGENQQHTEVPTSTSTTLTLSEHETSNILASLRIMQDMIENDTLKDYRKLPHFDDHPAMSSSDIDKLCEKL